MRPQLLHGGVEARELRLEDTQQHLGVLLHVRDHRAQVGVDQRHAVGDVLHRLHELVAELALVCRVHGVRPLHDQCNLVIDLEELVLESVDTLRVIADGFDHSLPRDPVKGILPAEVADETAELLSAHRAISVLVQHNLRDARALRLGA